MIKGPVRNEQPAAPAVGSLWKFKNNSPWPKRDYFVTVIDTKPGWVRYKIVNGGIYGDSQLRLDSFLICYQQAEPSTTKTA